MQALRSWQKNGGNKIYLYLPSNLPVSDQPKCEDFWSLKNGNRQGVSFKEKSGLI